MKRRHFIQQASLASASLLAAPLFAQVKTTIVSDVPNKLPRWRGFNLLEKFIADEKNLNVPFKEKDFEMMNEWGFDFVRIPMSYLCWMKQEDWLNKATPEITNEEAIKQVDQVIKFGKQYKVHVNLNMHRIQGYCVNPPDEPLSVWKDDKALQAAAWQWAYFAERYKGIPSTQLSFDLINEPANVDEPTYTKVVTTLVNAIREKDPERLIIADGRQYGTIPVFGLSELNIAESTRGYNPFQLTHYKASWVKSDNWRVPTWPMKVGDTVWDKQKLKENYIDPWKKLENQGVGVHVGEWGCYKYTPHDVVLSWMEDTLSLWQEAGWGWSLWNLRGPFGPLNSERSDVSYEDYKGEKLDRQMMELLRRY